MLRNRKRVKAQKWSQEIIKLILKLPEYKLSCSRYEDFCFGAYADINFITYKA